MDIRIQKTRKNIINSFIELRSKKAIEKITIKELCEKAEINKSTFYSHYSDIYDLSDSLENELLNSIISDLPDTYKAITEPEEFTRRLALSLTSHNSLLKILFSGNRSGLFIVKLNNTLKSLIFKKYPEYKDDFKINTMLSFLIYGGYYAYSDNYMNGESEVIELISQISKITFDTLLL